MYLTTTLLHKFVYVVFCLLHIVFRKGVHVFRMGARNMYGARTSIIVLFAFYVPADHVYSERCSHT